MSSNSKLILCIAAGFVGLVVLVAVVATLVFRANAKPRLQALASSALDMEVSVGGPVAVGFSPGLHIAYADVHAHKRGVEIASAAEIDVGIEILPLFRGEVRIGSLDLQRLRIAIERNRDGTLNVSRTTAVPATHPDWSVNRVSASDATVLYTNRLSGRYVEAADCSLDVGNLHFRSKEGSGVTQRLSLSGILACGQIQTNRITASDVQISADGKDGIFDFDPLAMHLLGGQGSGKIHADFTGSVPAYEVHYGLAQFRIDEFLIFMSPEKAERKSVGEGFLDLTTHLTLQGESVEELTQSAVGVASVHGRSIRLEIGDLDHKFSRLESSQRFSLVDVVGTFFAGPLALGITKGYDFARVFEGGDGSSAIRVLVSDWQVERGVAHATDVAMATDKNRVALKGNLDFVNGRFDDVTVALVDAEGCALARQKIRGPFGQPDVEKPDVLGAVTGPARTLVRQAKDLLGGKCEVFYAGSVESPI